MDSDDSEEENYSEEDYFTDDTEENIRRSRQNVIDKNCRQFHDNSKDFAFVLIPPFDTGGLSDQKLLRDGWDSQMGAALLNCSVVSFAHIDLADEPNMNSFLPYLSTNRFLRSVKLYACFEDEGIHRVLDSISRNSSIEELDLYVERPLNGVLAAIKQVRALTLRNNYGPKQCDAIGQTLKHSQKLHALRLHEQESVKHLLPHLVSHPTLKSLTFGAFFNAAFVDVLPYIADTTSLKRLEIEGVKFPSQQMIGPAINALKKNVGIEEVAITKCVLDRDSSDEVLRFLQVDGSPVHHFGIDTLSDDDGANRAFLSKLLVMPSLKTLTLGFGDKKERELVPERFAEKGLATYLAQVEDTVLKSQIPHWHLTHVTASGGEALANLLPKVVHVKELTLAGSNWRQNRDSYWYGPEYSLESLVPALKQNGSVTRISFITVETGEAHFKNPSPTDQKLLKKAQALCERNAVAPTLFKPVQQDDPDREKKRLVIPTVLLSVAHNAVFSGLLTMGESVVAASGGAAGGSKRVNNSD